MWKITSYLNFMMFLNIKSPPESFTTGVSKKTRFITLVIE